MKRQQIIGSIIGLLIMIGGTLLGMSLLIPVPPSSPTFGVLIATITTVFVVIEVVRLLLGRRRQRNSKAE